MSDTTQAFFERLATRGHEPLLHSVSGTIRCDIEDAGNWFVVVNNGALTVSTDTVEADCVIVCQSRRLRAHGDGKAKSHHALHAREDDHHR